MAPGSSQDVTRLLRAWAGGDHGRDLVAIDEALTALSKLDPRKGQLLSIDETAEVLQVSPRTVRREWSIARAWLFADLSAPV